MVYGGADVFAKSVGDYGAKSYQSGKKSQNPAVVPYVEHGLARDNVVRGYVPNRSKLDKEPPMRVEGGFFPSDTPSKFKSLNASPK